MHDSPLFRTLGITEDAGLRRASKATGIPDPRLRRDGESSQMPTGQDLERLLGHLHVSEEELSLRLGIVTRSMAKALSRRASEVARLLGEPEAEDDGASVPKPDFETSLGTLYRGDCIELMASLPSESIDLIFADPPFNLSKAYESGMNDDITESEYLDWTEQWVTQAVRLLNEGGSFFVWNLPKWNVHIAAMLERHLTFRHWIAVDIKYRLPIRGRLYPSHYSLLYYTRGDRPTTFEPERLPLEVCRHCAGDIRDYGGYKDKLNPGGMNLTDVWYDIPPVRHSKFKTRSSNELSLKLLERVISMASQERDVVLDPFGGSGTTYVAAELLGRRWLGMELGPLDSILRRFDNLDEQQRIIEQYQASKNRLFSDATLRRRHENGHWTPETLRTKKARVDGQRPDAPSQPKLLTD